ncbi:hypothetical protein LIER_06664 [Lithospermum erythrorhizon]|uniref:Reverse transcriptase domain-containing protein n=1 Tax=Lithospermum erythrorhizon TaxID=34254 RepID=A0AAV3P7W2_LITER
MVNKVLSTQVGRTIEIYVDDMLIKSWGATGHEANLWERFGNLQKYNLWLNLGKGVFRVASRKFLGYMISPREFEPNSDKIAAVQATQSPKSNKKVQGLTGKVATWADSYLLQVPGARPSLRLVMI